MADITISAEGAVYRVPLEELERYRVEESEVSGFADDPFGGLVARPDTQLSVRLGNSGVVTQGSRIIFSAETVVQTSIR